MPKASGSRSVLVAPDYSILQVARGRENFENEYHGLSVNNALWLSDKKSGKDPQAEVAYKKVLAGWANKPSTPTDIATNDTGIDPWLQRGIPVPLGSWVVIWLPYISVGSEDPPATAVRYLIGWRTRSATAYALNRQPYHAAFDGLGEEDDGSLQMFVQTGGATPCFSGAGLQRRLMVASWEPVKYLQTEPSPGGYATEDIWQLTLKVNPATNVDAGSMSFNRPIFPGFPGLTGASVPYVYGSLQQGYLKNEGPAGIGVTPLYVPYATKAKGDELLLGVAPDSTEDASNYDFDGAHYALSLLFGRAGYETGNASIADMRQHRQLGVYITTGTGP